MLNNLSGDENFEMANANLVNGHHKNTAAIVYCSEGNCFARICTEILLKFHFLKTSTSLKSLNSFAVVFFHILKSSLSDGNSRILSFYHLNHLKQYYFMLIGR